jgi:hypothetical protein
MPIGASFSIAVSEVLASRFFNEIASSIQDEMTGLWLSKLLTHFDRKAMLHDS